MLHNNTWLAISCSNTGEIVAILREGLEETVDYFPMIVWRDAILRTSLSRLGKKSFSPAKKFKVLHHFLNDK